MTGAVVEVELAPEAADRALGALSEIAVELELLDGEDPPLIVARFDALDPSAAREEARRVLAEAGLDAKLIARPLSQAESSDSWMLRTIHAGSLRIVPAGRTAPPDALSIEAGLSFGTGHHPTTLLCLERIAELSPIDTLLDVGTGSGILGLAALKLGARQVYATERDRAALALARENAAKNGLTDRFAASLKKPEDLGVKVSVIVANIIASALLNLAPELVRCLGSNATLLLSGVRESEVLEVSRAYTAFGLAQPLLTEREGWVMLELRTRW